MDGVGNKGLEEGRRNKEVWPGELVGMAYHAGRETLVLYISDARRGGSEGVGLSFLPFFLSLLP